ncbi:hypothetical protein [Arvimicrobium flavum]|uniref:hypothetical protein n=1 Tax=Arvimicrobium flavum TaxID=3393320 RepID=UPI00237B8B36|nr:hypothetical protein [Mesorhizobium shangrilense]
MNHLEKYLPKPKNPSAQAVQRDRDLWDKAVSRVNGTPRDTAKDEARNDDGTGRLNNR